jgi:flagellar motor switch protein FliN
MADERPDGEESQAQNPAESADASGASPAPLSPKDAPEDAPTSGVPDAPDVAGVSDTADVTEAAEAAMSALEDAAQAVHAAADVPGAQSAATETSGAGGDETLTLPDMGPGDVVAGAASNGSDGPEAGLNLLGDVSLDVKIELGRTHMYVEDVLRLNTDSVIELDKAAGDPVDIYVNQRHVARGEVLVLNENFCVRIGEIIRPTTED